MLILEYILGIKFLSSFTWNVLRGHNKDPLDEGEGREGPLEEADDEDDEDDDEEEDDEASLCSDEYRWDERMAWQRT